MELGLQGKVALVTGASKGIGKAIAEECVREGVHVALWARSAVALTEQEVPALAVSLASRRASSINSVLVQVDGGATRCI